MTLVPAVFCSWLILAGPAAGEGETAVSAAMARCREGIALLNQSEFKRACRKLRQAVAEAPELPVHCHLALAAAYNRTGKHGKAGELARKVLDLTTEPQSRVLAYNELAFAKVGAAPGSLEAYEAAEAALRQALDLDAGMDRVLRLNLATFHIDKAGKFDLARAEAARSYAEGLHLLRELLDEEPHGPRSAGVRYLLCGTPTCEPAVIYESVKASSAGEDSSSDASSPERIYVSGYGVTPPRKLKAFAPQYSIVARKRRVQGVVIVQAVIGEDGRVRDLRVLQGLPCGLTEAAVKAISGWRFLPATKDGEPVAVYYNLTVSFMLQ